VAYIIGALSPFIQFIHYYVCMFILAWFSISVTAFFLSKCSISDVTTFSISIILSGVSFTFHF
jgi:hypothetical protein